MKDRPTGIIRTLPYGPKHSEAAMRVAYAKMIHGLERLNRLDAAHVLAGYETGIPAVPCWDGSTRRHKYWAVLTAPYEPAPEPIKKRGFQGFRYTEGLW